MLPNKTENFDFLWENQKLKIAWSIAEENWRKEAIRHRMMRKSAADQLKAELIHFNWKKPARSAVLKCSLNILLFNLYPHFPAKCFEHRQQVLRVEALWEHKGAGYSLSKTSLIHCRVFQCPAMPSWVVQGPYMLSWVAQSPATSCWVVQGPVMPSWAVQCPVMPSWVVQCPATPGWVVQGPAMPSWAVQCPVMPIHSCGAPSPCRSAPTADLSAL